MNTLASSFLIGSSSDLQVMRTSIIHVSQTSSKFGQIGPRTAKLAALERLEKIPIDLYKVKSCEHFSSSIIASIILILAG